jgi:hypothetical protein
MECNYTRWCLVAALICLLGLGGVGARNLATEPVAPSLPFGPAEQLVYEGKLSRSVLRGITVVELHFSAARRASSGHSGTEGTEPELQFTADAASRGMFTKLFGIHFHQRVESLVDPVSFNLLHANKIDEQGARRRTSETVVEREKRLLTWTELDPNDPSRPPRVIVSHLDGPVQDVASAIYFLRTQPLRPGAKLEIPISDSGRIYRAPFRVAEKTHMGTVLGNVPVVRIEADVFGEDGLFPGQGSVSVWLTDDARHVPVRAHVNTEMGTLDIKLKSIASPGKKA